MPEVVGSSYPTHRTVEADVQKLVNTMPEAPLIVQEAAGWQRMVRLVPVVGMAISTICPVATCPAAGSGSSRVAVPVILA